MAAATVLGLSVLTAPLLPLFDPDEGYYPATASESLRSGSSWDLRLNGERRWDKPYLPYAVVQSSFALFGESVTAARLPSALQGSALVLVVGIVVSRLAGRSAGQSAAWVLATTIGVQVFSRIAHPEIAVVLGITAADLLFALWLAEPSHRRWWVPVAAGGCIGYGALAKGPVALALPLLTIAGVAWLSRKRRFNWTGALSAGAFALLAAGVVVVPWYVAMTYRHGWSFLSEALWRHNVARYAGAEFGHRKPFWYFVLPTLLGLFPWSGFVPVALPALSSRDQSSEALLRLTMLSAAATSFLFYSASASKLAHYALVIVPPMAVLIGLYLDRIRQSESGGGGAFSATVVILAVFGVVFLFLPWSLNRVIDARELLGGAPIRDHSLEQLIAWTAWSAAAILIVGAALIAVSRRPVTRQAVVIGIGILLPLSIVITSRSLIRTTYPWERFGREVSVNDAPIWLLGPRAPSLTFYAGRPVRRLDVHDAEEYIPPSAEGWMIVPSDWLEGAQTREPWRSLRMSVVDRTGTMTLLRVAPKHKPMARMGPTPLGSF